jgi:putative aminopeptidase FrvX
MEIITTAYVFSVDENLGNAAAAATFSCHSRAGCFIAIDCMFGVNHLFAI